MFIKKFAGAALVAVVLAGNAFSQEDARIPFVVNVDATVSATRGSDTVRITVESDVEQVMTITAGILVSVRHGAANRQITAANLRVDSRGNLNLNLPQSDYHNAAFSLYSINGRRVMHTNVNETTRNFTRSNVAPGVYIMSVKGVNGHSFTTRFNHRGGAMNVNVSYGEIYYSDLRRETAAFLTSGEEWNIRVRATGHVDSVYTLAIVGGDNPRQTITLRSSSDNGGGEPTCTAGQDCPDDVGTCTVSEICSNNVLREDCIGTFSVGASCTFTVTLNSEGTGATGGGNYVEGQTVRISAGTRPFNYIFNNWTSDNPSVNFQNQRSESTSFVMPGSSVTITANFELLPQFHPGVTYGTLVDSRDGQTYRTVTITYRNLPIDSQTWMAENLNYDSGTASSQCLDYDPTNCDIYGRLYDWNTAMAGSSSSDAIPSGVQGICPDGWHLPSYEEWNILINASSSVESMRGEFLKSPFGWMPHTNVRIGTNRYGFSALGGGGTQQMADGNFSGGRLGYAGFWWTATERDADFGRLWSMYNDHNSVIASSSNKTQSRNSVRCIKDD